MMQNINNYILEKLKKINSKNTGKQYNYFPKDNKELKRIIKDLIKERGDKADLNDIDTSEIIDMSRMFAYSKFNGDISKWDVSNVEDMNSMFYISNFKGDISEWDVSNVKDMSYMFTSSKFTGKNGDISNWNVSNDQNMHYMFYKSGLANNPPKWYNQN